MPNTLSPNDTATGAFLLLNQVAAHAVEGLIRTSQFISSLVADGMIKDEAVEAATLVSAALAEGAEADRQDAMLAIAALETAIKQVSKPKIIIPNDAAVH